jgi:short-subunit dehydrogenase
MENTNKNKTVLITGASGGIGLELARLFAKDNYNMVVVSRNEEHLQHLSVEFKGLGAESVTVIAKDLACVGSAEAVYMMTKQMGIHVDVLVNDAGAGEHGKFLETDLQKELKIIHLNICSVVELTKYYLKDMVTKGDGKILQLASVASYQPTPLLAVYAATKAFVLSFTDSLINELQDTGVTMTALIPTATKTNFFNNAGAENTKVVQDGDLDDPKVVAQAGYDALMSGKHHALPPGVRGQVLMSSMMPNEAVASMARKQMEPVTNGKEKVSAE